MTGGPLPPFTYPRVEAPLPKAPGATLSLVLGIVSLGGLFVLLVPAFLAPLACYHAVAARRRIDREPSRWSGRGEAQAGLVLGTITCGLVMIALGLLLLAALGVTIASGQDSGYGR